MEFKWRFRAWMKAPALPLLLFLLGAILGCPQLEPKGEAMPGRAAGRSTSPEKQTEKDYFIDLKRYLVSFGNGEPAGYTLEKTLSRTRLSGTTMMGRGARWLWPLAGSDLAVETAGGMPLSLIDLSSGKSVGIDFLPQAEPMKPGWEWWIYQWQERPLVIALRRPAPAEARAYQVGIKFPPGRENRVLAGLIPYPGEEPAQLVLPVGQKRLLFGYLDERERGSYQLEVDPETGQVRGKDERRTLRDRFVVAEKPSPEQPLRSVGEVELTVLEPRTKPPEFVESPWFVDGDLLIQLRSSPDAPLGEPNFRLYYWRLGGEKMVRRGGIRLPMSTVECFALRGDPRGRYVVVICPPDPRLPLPEGKAETHLMLVDLVRGRVRFDETLPLAEGRLGISHLIRGRNWLMVGSWEAASAEQAGRGSFWYLDFAGRVPEIRRVNLTAGQVKLIPPSNLELAWLGHGAVVREVDHLSLVEDHTILTLGLSEQGTRELLRLSVPRFEVLERAPLPPGRVVMFRSDGEREVELVTEEKWPTR